MSQRNVFWFVDAQIDFMDLPGSALPVPGGNLAMSRAAELLREMPLSFFDNVMATFDSHDYLHWAHPMMWEDKNGNAPQPFTPISHASIKAGDWRPRFANEKPAELGGRTIGEWALYYTEALEASGQKVHMIWPPHCIPGTPGWALQPDVESAIRNWCTAKFRSLTRLTKGNCVWTEHFGGFEAGVPLPSDPTTQLNKRILQTFEKAKKIYVAGVASSHCVPATIMQAAEYFGWNNANKFVLLTDCMAPVGPICDNNGNVIVDFPKIASDWLADMKSRGMEVIASTDVLQAA